MYSSRSDAAQATNANSGPSTAAKSTELHGFTWSHDPATSRTRTPASLDGGDSTDGDGVDQPLYSKLYERFIEKREVFVHSNIDVRRSVSVNQSATPQRYSSLSRLPPATSYTHTDCGPLNDDESLHGSWEFSNLWPVEDYTAPGASYYSPAPHHSRAVPEPSFPPIRPISPSMPHSHHQPLPARFHSSYSELSANVAYLSEMKSQSTSSRRISSSETPPAPAIISPEPELKRHQGSSTPAEPSSSHRTTTQPRPIARRKNVPDGEQRSDAPSPRALGKALSGKKSSDVRRQPSLACFFCRERKIACGRPAEGSADRTCNQCARRSYPCDYPTESMRGQHKRRKTLKDGK